MPNGNVIAGHVYGYRKPAKTSMAEKLAAVPFAIFITMLVVTIFAWGPIAFRKQK